MKFTIEASLPGYPDFSPVPIRLLAVGDEEVIVSGTGGSEGATHQIVLAAGSPMITHLPARDQVVSAELARVGYWEYPESMLLLSVAAEGMVCVDAGANIGYYSVLLARSVGRLGKIISFEPEPANFLVLLANLMLQQVLSSGAYNFSPFQLALSDAVGTAGLNLYGDNLGFHSLVFSEGSESQATVKTLTLDRLRGLDGSGDAIVGDRIGLIKADIQGGELKLIRGATRTLRADRPLLCLEFEPYIAGDGNCLELLDALVLAGYSRFRVFHSDIVDPALSLQELSRVLSRADVAGLVAEKRVGAFGTVFATPDP